MAFSILRKVTGQGFRCYNSRLLPVLTNFKGIELANSSSKFIARLSSSVSQQFEEAKNKLNSLENDPGNEVKLKLYALFKQATVGKCSSKQPGVFDIVGRAKWSAWNSLNDMTTEEAQTEYIRTVDGLGAAKGTTSESATTSTGGDQYKTLTVTRDGVMQTIVLNRPDKKNAINLDMYAELKKVLHEIGNDTGTVVTVITGAGGFYCSGNDLSNFTELGSKGGSMGDMAKNGSQILNDYVSSFIDFPKILVALVNGPAIGIAVTVLGLFDLVLASDKATFHTPFSTLGQSPEGVSSFTFPFIMGATKANEMLLFNRKLTAREAEQRGLVTEVYPDHTFRKEALERIKYIASLPPQSLLLSKQLVRNRLLDKYHQINDEECKLLVERWQSDECLSAITSFMQRKSKM